MNMDIFWWILGPVKVCFACVCFVLIIEGSEQIFV